MRKLLLITLMFTLVLTSSLFATEFFIAARGGMVMPGEEIYSFQQDFFLWGEDGYFENDMMLDSGFGFGAGFGLLFTKEIGIRVDVDMVSLDATSNFSLRSPNPWYWNSHQTASVEFTGITDDLIIIHGDLFYRVPMGKKMFFSIGAGVSIWTGDLYALDDFSFSWQAPSTLSVTSGDFLAYSESFYGFNVFGALEFMMGKDMSISVEGRYSSASGDLPLPDYLTDQVVEVSIGGIFLMASINLYM